MIVPNNKLLSTVSRQIRQYEYLKTNVSCNWGYQMDLLLLQNNNIFTSWNFPNLKTFIPDE